MERVGSEISPSGILGTIRHVVRIPTQMSREIIINLMLSGSIQFQVYCICLQQNGQDRTDLHTTKIII